MTNLPPDLSNPPADTALTNFNWLATLGPFGWTFLLVFLLCYFIRRIKQVPNILMTPATLVGMLFFIYIGPRFAGYDDGQNTAIRAVIGMILGIIATLAAWGAHDKVMAYFAQKWPLLSIFVSDDVNQKTNPNP